jgi:ATP-dependent DNA helicase RecG
MNSKEYKNLQDHQHCLEETETIELKSGIAELEDAVIDICALLNNKGGIVYFGVDPKGKIIGMTVSDTTFRKVSQKIRARIKPDITLSYNSENINGKTALKITIPEGTNKPYFADGQAYIRSGTESIRMPVDDLKWLIRQENDNHWDNRPCLDATLEDINPEEVMRFLRQMQDERRSEIDVTIPFEKALERLNLLSSGVPTNAAVLMFAKDPQRFIIQSEVKAGRFKGTDMSDGFLDMSEPIKGPLPTQLKIVEEFIRKHTNRKVIIGSNSFSRVEEWDYPLQALREAVINALCHRDYNSSANVQIRIFDDRIEIWNPGTLPSDISLESLKEEHLSRPRNKNVARLLYLIKIIEQWGSGTTTMVASCRKYGLLDPEFFDNGYDFRVVIRKNVTSEINRIISSLNDRQIIAFEHMLKNQTDISSGEYALLCDCNERTARSDLKIMIELGVVVRTGGSKRTRYSILDRFRIDSGSFPDRFRITPKKGKE